ncbi:MAG TPA: hypothetical protein VGC14_18415 [Rhizobium sp.]
MNNAARKLQGLPNEDSSFAKEIARDERTQELGMTFELPILPIALVLAITSPAAPTASKRPPLAPFGISQDTMPSALDCSLVYGGTADSTGQYVCRNLPEGSELFDEYILAFVKGIGICNVVAVSPYIEDDRQGSETRAVFRKAAALMTAQLGPADEKVDYAVSAAAKSGGRFKTAIISEDRQIFDQWNNLALRFKNAQSASLVISGSEDFGLAVYSVFRFADNDSCLQKMELTTGISGDE